MENPKVFDCLRAINVNDHTETKNGLTYLTWAWAWDEVKVRFSDVSYEIVKFENNLPYVYDPKTGYMVFTKVTINGETKEMWLPVMDSSNNAMKAEQYTIKCKGYTKTVEPATMFDINKTIMRCLVKNLAMFGLGLYIYAGEDLPEDEREKVAKEPEKKKKVAKSDSNSGADQILVLIKSANTIEDLQKYKQYASDPTVKEALLTRYSEINNVKA